MRKWLILRDKRWHERCRLCAKGWPRGLRPDAKCRPIGLQFSETLKSYGAKGTNAGCLKGAEKRAWAA